MLSYLFLSSLNIAVELNSVKRELQQQVENLKNTIEMTQVSFNLYPLYCTSNLLNLSPLRLAPWRSERLRRRRMRRRWSV